MGPLLKYSYIHDYATNFQIYPDKENLSDRINSLQNRFLVRMFSLQNLIQMYCFLQQVMQSIKAAESWMTYTVYIFYSSRKKFTDNFLRVLSGQKGLKFIIFNFILMFFSILIQICSEINSGTTKAEQNAVKSILEKK